MKNGRVEVKERKSSRRKAKRKCGGLLAVVPRRYTLLLAGASVRTLQQGALVTQKVANCLR